MLTLDGPDPHVITGKARRGHVTSLWAAELNKGLGLMAPGWWFHFYKILFSRAY